MRDCSPNDRPRAPSPFLFFALFASTHAAADGQARQAAQRRLRRMPIYTPRGLKVRIDGVLLVTYGMITDHRPGRDTNHES